MLGLINDADPLERQNAKLLKVTAALMRRVEQTTDESGAAYSHFQRALELEDQVRAHTRDLEATLELLNQSNARLSQAMREAEAARADLSNALESVREGFALFDRDDLLVMCNSRFCQALPDLSEHLRPGLRFLDYVRLVAKSRHLSLPQGQTRLQWMKERLDNHRLQWANFNVQTTSEVWIQVSEQRTPGNGTAILQTDITELIHLERQERDKLLDEQARLIRATLDHVDQGICIFDAEQRLVGWNSRLRALLIPPMQLLRVGVGFATLAEYFRRALVRDDGPRVDRLLDWVTSRATRLPLALELKTRNGVRLDLFAQEMPDRGFVISFTDVTAEREAKLALQAANESLEQHVLERTLALKDALAEAERANTSKSRFVAAASHDLLQPLSAAKLFLASLETAEPGTDLQATLGRVRSAFDSAESILGALLDISRLDSGHAAVTMSTIQLDTLFTRLGNEFREMARQKGLELRVVPCGLSVRSDAPYLRRIIQNLLANAIRYTRRGKVLLGARRRGGTARIEVWDTGPGIPASEHETVFREFQRLASGEGSGGIGLGLTIVKRACALLDHPLELVSAEGRGTGFRVTVPATGRAEIAVADTQTSDAATGEASGLLALLIEDDAVVREALAGLLETWGVGTLDSGDTESAIALLDELGITPDVILADYQLENGDGLDAIAKVRARHGPIPAMLITANRSPALATRCRGLGIPLLNKPVEPARLRGWLSTNNRMT